MSESPASPAASLLRFSPRLTVLPVIHGSGDFAVEVRRRMLTDRYDCLAIPLPPSFRESLEEGVLDLPAAGLAWQREPRQWQAPEWESGGWQPTEWQPEGQSGQSSDSDPASDPDSDSAAGSAPEALPTASYVPIDPCQPFIAAIRAALSEHIPREYIDLETARYEPHTQIFPDPYAIQRADLELFAAALLPVLPPPTSDQRRARIATQAARLRQLERRYRSILCLCSFSDWPWLREAYNTAAEPAVDDDVEPTERFDVSPATLLFLLGELPYVTGLYEQARADLDDDGNLSIDGVKSLLLAARDRDRQKHGRRARKLSPKALALYLKYVRNLSLIERRMTPDLYTLVLAARQMAGDRFAISLVETAREYPFPGPPELTTLALGLNRARLPGGEEVALHSRLEGPPVEWRSLELRRDPDRKEQAQWAQRWNPYSHCSWPPEDVAIEKFRSHVKDRARALMGLDLARSEKFTTSLRDGLDLRETLRNFHTGDLYVKVLPPSRGSLDCVVMLFDSPADPRQYPWRVTWFAEHQDESTLALFATDFTKEFVGPGIGQATYGGALFLFPPRPIPEIWTDRRLNFAGTLEERLLAAGCLHSQFPHVVLLSESPPGMGFRKLARQFGKKLLHIPLGSFSQETIAQLRIVHVLNGRHIRSHAADFIRKA
jgi:hypothetical protein